MPESPGTRTERCPLCGATVPVTPGYVTWCECGWNIRPAEQAERPATLRARLYARLSARAGERLFASVKHAAELRPRTGLGEVLLVTMSIAVVLSTPVLLAAAITILVLWPNCGALVLAAALTFVGLLLIPRGERRPEHVEAPEREYPALHGFVARVADTIGAPRPDVIVLTWEFNAFTTHTGLRRRRQLALGLPMLAALDLPHWVALIGHELGHFCNGDVTRGFWTGTALNTIGAWHELLAPDSITGHDEGIAGDFSRLVMWLLSLIPAAVYRPLAWLSWTSAQRASTSPTGYPRRPPALPPPSEFWSRCWRGAPSSRRATPSFMLRRRWTCSRRSSG